MDLNLHRNDYGAYGIFGELFDKNGLRLFCTLEHAFLAQDGSVYAKVPKGIYTCIRHPPHRLPYETFMLENVPDHDGILFHIGNYNHDSDGCILLGHEIFHGGSEHMLLDSRLAFNNFMVMQANLAQFQLVVS